MQGVLSKLHGICVEIAWSGRILRFGRRPHPVIRKGNVLYSSFTLNAVVSQLFNPQCCVLPIMLDRQPSEGEPISRRGGNTQGLAFPVLAWFPMWESGGVLGRPVGSLKCTERGLQCVSVYGFAMMVISMRNRQASFQMCMLVPVFVMVERAEHAIG